MWSVESHPRPTRKRERDDSMEAWSGTTAWKRGAGAGASSGTTSTWKRGAGIRSVHPKPLSSVHDPKRARLPIREEPRIGSRQLVAVVVVVVSKRDPSLVAMVVSRSRERWAVSGNSASHQPLVVVVGREREPSLVVVVDGRERVVVVVNARMDEAPRRP